MTPVPRRSAAAGGLLRAPGAGGRDRWPASWPCRTSDARRLLEGAEVELPDADVDELVGRTEGWPVGLYLAALAVKAGGPRTAVRPPFTGDDRFMADYLRSELLAHLPQPRVAFLTRTAVLDRMSGPLCDAVLAADRSRLVLESLEGSNLLVVRWTAPRVVPLPPSVPRAAPGRARPARARADRELHTRAAACCEANGLPEMAIDHAQAAETPTGRPAGPPPGPPAYAGAASTPSAAGGLVRGPGTDERYPASPCTGPGPGVAGQAGGAERWASAAERGTATGTVPDGSTVESWLAMARALLCRDGVERMGADVRIALAGLAPASTWRATALLLEGLAFLLEGEVERADPVLAHAVEVATDAGAMPAAATALAERSLVAIQHRDCNGPRPWRAGPADQSGRVPGRLPPHRLVHGVVARTALHRGDGPRAREHLARRPGAAATHYAPDHGRQTLSSWCAPTWRWTTPPAPGGPARRPRHPPAGPTRRPPREAEERVEAGHDPRGHRRRVLA